MVDGVGDSLPSDLDTPAGSGQGLRASLAQPSVRLGVLGAVVTFLFLGTLLVLAIPPFLPADESAHTGYALDVADGRIPRVDEKVKVELPGQVPTRQWVAQHPPLYYAIVGPVLDWGDGSNHEYAAIRITRGFTVLLGAGAAVVAAALAAVVVNRRRAETMILAAGLVATLPGFLGISAAIHNDLLAVTSMAVGYLGAAAAVADRPRRWNVIATCVGGAVSMATRVNGVGLLAMCCAALAFAGWYRMPGSTRRRLLWGLGLGAAPVLTAALTSGWWWLRNKRIYGDYLGTSYGEATGGRQDLYTPFSWLTDRKTFPDLVTRIEGGGPWEQLKGFGWYDRKIIGLIVVVLMVGAVTGLVAAARRWNASGRRRPDLGRVALLAFMVGMPVLALLQLSYYVATMTGSPNPRYMFAVVPVGAVGVAWACHQLPRRVSVVAGSAILAFQVVLIAGTTGRYINTRTSPTKVPPLDQVYDSMADAGVPGPRLVVWLLIVGALAGVGLQAWAMWRAGDSDERAVGEGDRRDEVDGHGPEVGVVVGVAAEGVEPAVVQ